MASRASINIPIVADPAPAEAGFEAAAQSAEKFTVKTSALADRNVQKLAEQYGAIHSLAKAYADVARSSETSSVQQVAALQKMKGEFDKLARATGGNAAIMTAAIDDVRNSLLEAAAASEKEIGITAKDAAETKANAAIVNSALDGVIARRMVASGSGGSGSGGGGLLGTLGWGHGMFGMAAFGSLLGLAGFGAERAVTSTLGILGSMGGGLLGGGLLGLGALGTSAVGMGTDMAGIGQAANDIKKVSQAYSALQNAIQMYGRGSSQAAQAQAQLNQTLGSFSPVARNAVLAAAQTAQGFKKLFDQATGQAEKTGAQIIQQAMLVGEKFLPTIGKFAAQNMTIIQRQLQPLFSWLSNPSFQGPGRGGGLGIFTNLEQIFQKNLPTAVHAGSQAFELLVKTIDVAAQHLGGFTKKIDEIFTKLNGPGFKNYSDEVNKLIGLFDTWLHLFTSLGKMIYEVFRPGVRFGKDFAKQLTSIVDLTNKWLEAKGTRDVLKNLFAAHKAQLDAIFQVIRALWPVLEQAASWFLQIEGTVARITVGPLKAFALLIQQINRVPLLDKLIGWGLALVAARKAFEAILALKWVATMTSWGSAVGPQGLSGKLGTAEGKAGGLLGNLKGLAGFGAITIGLDLVAHAKGLSAKSVLGSILLGAGAGAMIGGPEGAGIGALLAGGALTVDVFLNPSQAKTHGLNKAFSGALVGDFGKAEIVYDPNTGRYFAEKKGGKEMHPFGSLAAAQKYAGKGAPIVDVSGRGTVGTGRGTANTEAKRIVNEGERYGGTGGGRYQLGGGHTTGAVKPGTALDCSGFVYQSLRAAGVKGFSDGNAASQFKQLSGGGYGNWRASDVGVSGAKAGDVVYYDIPGNVGEGQPSHCGIVVSGSGSSAQVMQYFNSRAGSGVTGILDQPGSVAGVFRIVIIKTPGGGGASVPSGVGTPTSYQHATGASPKAQAAASAASRHASAVTALLLGRGSHAQNLGTVELAKANADMAAAGNTKDPAKQFADYAKAYKKFESYRKDETDALRQEEAARKKLAADVKNSTGQAKQQYQAALKTIRGNIASTKAAIVKAGQDMATATADKAQTLTSILQNLETAVDAQFQAQIQPLQDELNALQAQATAQNDQQQVDQAQTALNQALLLGDPQAIIQAQQQLQQAQQQQQQDQIQAQINAIQQNEDDFNTAIEALIGQVNGTGTNSVSGVLTQLVATVGQGSSVFQSVISMLAQYAGVTVPGGSGSSGGGGGGGAGTYSPPPGAHSPGPQMLGMLGRNVRPVPVSSASGGGDIHLHVHGHVIGTGLDKAARELTPHIRREMLRTKARNAHSYGLA